MRIPTLEPSREGFTQTGQAHLLHPLAPAGIAGGAEVHLRDAGVAEEPLEDQLVDRGRRREHAGSDVGDVEALEQPLNGSVLAEGAVEDREGDVAVEQPAGGAEVDVGSPLPQ